MTASPSNLETLLQRSPLGKKVKYLEEYTPSLLYAVPRAHNRAELGITEGQLPFYGVDIWNAYEFSWLNARGKPHIAIAEFYFPSDSNNIVESKSVKLYLNSFCQTKFASIDDVKQTLINDLSTATESSIAVSLLLDNDFEQLTIARPEGICLDHLEITCDTYDIQPQLLTTDPETCAEMLYTYLLKSNCPVTGQPDWATLLIRYEGQKINHENLLKYIVSYRKNVEFHEQCIERIFLDILKYCNPSKLTLDGRYMRRGGIDIRVFRSNCEVISTNERWFRQ